MKENNENVLLNIDFEYVEDKLLKFLNDEISSAGMSKAVIGLSGGVDSAVSCILTAKAIGSKNVYAVYLPYKTSSPQSLIDAEKVAEVTGVNFNKVDITEMSDAFISGAGDIGIVRKGNVYARMRMIVLYDISAEKEALVIGTSNKSEILLGYGTLFGDLAAAINPLGNLYKTQVWELARRLKLPESVIEKKPTADLWEGQTDEKELGFTYKEVDLLLYEMIDKKKNNNELKKMGFEENFIDRVRELIGKSEFKRRMPLIASI